MNGLRCSASQFLLQYIKCVFFTAYGFSFHSRGERSCSEADVCARVWWAPWICQLSVFLLFSLRCHSFLSLFCFSFISLLNHSLVSSLTHSLSYFPHFLTVLLALFIPSFLFSSLSLFFLSFFSPPLSFLPRRSHGSLVVRLLEGIPTPPPPPLEPLFLSLRPLPRSRLFFSSSFSSLLFSSSLFNVEVLSNCWLLLWLGGNGIFRRMPHAVALTHSWVPPSHTQTLKHTNIGGYRQWF